MDFQYISVFKMEGLCHNIWLIYKILNKAAHEGSQKKKEKKKRNSYSTRSPNFCFRVEFLALISPLEKPDQWKVTWCESLVSSLPGTVWNSVYLAGNPALEAQATSAQKTKMVHREHCSQPDLHLCTKRLHFFLNDAKKASKPPVSSFSLTCYRESSDSRKEVFPFYK